MSVSVALSMNLIPVVDSLCGIRRCVTDLVEPVDQQIHVSVNSSIPLPGRGVKAFLNRAVDAFATAEVHQGLC